MGEVVDETVIEVFSTKIGIAGSGLYFENTLLNRKKRYNKSSSAKIEDDTAFNLLVETLGDRSSLLALRVVEISGDSDDIIVNSYSEVCFRSFLHLDSEEDQ